MPSFEAIEERKWGSFPALRKVLAAKRLPNNYYGLTSVSDTIFDRIHCTLEIALLARECESEIREAAVEPMEVKELSENLFRPRNELDGAISFLGETSRKVERLYRTL